MAALVVPRILVLGLGGTGELALLELKRLFNPQRPGTVPPYVRLLYVDTVASESRGGVALQEVECLPLFLRDPRAVLDNPANAHLKTWFPEGLAVQTLVHGAAQVRPLGRLALHAQVERFLHQLGNCLDTLMDRARLREMPESIAADDQGSIEVYVLASLCGGTGSGICIDVAQLVRNELRDAPTVRVFGVFLLPGPFRRHGATSRVAANAYAALKELDYLANLQTALEVDFGAGRTVTIDRSPFDMIYLVDSVGERYDTTTSIQQLARQMAYLPYLMSTTAVGTHVRGILHNLLPQLEAKPRVQGKRATYASFGVATLELPESSVARARRAFERELLQQLVADTNTARSLGDLGMPNTIEACQVAFPADLEMSLIECDFRNRHEPIDQLEQIYRAALLQVEDYARAYAAPRLEAWCASEDTALQSLMHEGATHAGQLEKTAAECRRLHTMLRERRDALRAPDEEGQQAEEKRREAWSLCQQAFTSRRRRRREPAAQAWKDVVNSWVLPVHLTRTLNALVADALGFLIDQAQAVTEWCEKALHNVRATIELLSPEDGQAVAPPSPFEQYADATQVRPRPEAHAFLAALPDAVAWFTGAATEMRSAVAAFADQTFTPAFASGGQGSATRLLLAAPYTTMETLRRFAAPMWSYTASKIPVRDHPGIHAIEVLGLERLSGEAQTALGGYPGLDLVETGWWDRVVHLQIRAGIPLFALTCMDDLWRDYLCVPDRQSRQSFYGDRRWVGWPELRAHDFPLAVVEVFARGLASSQIIYQPGEGLTYSSETGPSQRLGASFLETYRLLQHDESLYATIARAGQNGHARDLAAQVETLREVLRHDRVPTPDRPLVEALLQRLERMIDMV